MLNTDRKAAFKNKKLWIETAQLPEHYNKNNTKYFDN